jgi:uncharacterized membrane protein
VAVVQVVAVAVAVAAAAVMQLEPSAAQLRHLTLLPLAVAVMIVRLEQL